LTKINAREASPGFLGAKSREGQQMIRLVLLFGALFAVSAQPAKAEIEKYATYGNWVVTHAIPEKDGEAGFCESEAMFTNGYWIAIGAMITSLPRNDSWVVMIGHNNWKFKKETTVRLGWKVANKEMMTAEFFGNAGSGSLGSRATVPFVNYLAVEDERPLVVYDLDKKRELARFRLQGSAGGVRATVRCWEEAQKTDFRGKDDGTDPFNNPRGEEKF
jgi:hypothetical protein